MDDLLKDFLTESSEQLEAIDSQLLRFEREPSDARILANIFRLVHVIKSACGFLNLRRLEKIARCAETLIVRLRDHAAPNAEAVALVLATVDRIKFILAAVAESGGEPFGDDDSLIREIETAAEAGRDGSLVPQARSAWEGALGPATTPPERRANSVRVPLQTLERLTSLAAELTLTRNQLVAVAGEANVGALHMPLRRLSIATADLQTGLQAARMLPVERLFANLHRLVRDLSADLGKKVELTLRGGNIEIDRQLIEAVRDPLAQLIRNAVGHGVESPEERRSLGKSEVGVIEVSACAEAGIVAIEVADDGRGLDFEAIRERALASGLGPRAELAALSSSDLSRFVFSPGFGAARRVGGASGRGSGLDIVRANIEPVGGLASLTSRAGFGVTVRLQIPLPTSILPAFILKSGDERFALPQRSVEEIVDLASSAGGVLIDVRGTVALGSAEGILPAGYLHALMGSPAQSPNPIGNLHIAMKMRVGQQGFALIVDEMIDVQQIAPRPLPTPLRSLPAFSGATVLGDGSVVLVLDPSGLASALGLPASSVPQVAPAQRVKARSALANFVVFRAGGPTLRALPVSAVARVLPLESDQIEFADGECFIRDPVRRIPLVDIGGRRSAESRAHASMAVLLTRDDGSLGLIVDEVVDVVEEELNHVGPNSDHAAPGTTMLRGEAIEIFDPNPLFDRLRGSRPPAMPEGAGVLILEPVGFFQTMIAGTLGRNGYHANAVGDLAAARTILAAEPPIAAALVDVDFAIAHEGELARQIGEAASRRPPVLIGLASHGGRTLRAKALTAGLSTAVGKFDRAAMLAALRAAVDEMEAAA